jgi:AraC-like DNA-binding protein
MSEVEATPAGTLSYDAPMVRYREIRPCAQLQPFISTFWILEHDAGDTAAQRVVPDGHSELILNWSHPFQVFRNGRWLDQPRCFFAGQLDGPLLLRPTGVARMLGIGFHPDGASGLLCRPVQELSGLFTSVDDISSRLSRSLDDALNGPNAVARVEAALLSCATAARRTDLVVGEAIKRIENAKGAVDVAVLAKELTLSTRQLERRFLATVGLPPKLFSRIQRFTGVYAAIGQASCNWVETAVSCGYYDQAHLIRDCRRLAGVTPKSLLDKDADLARHFYRRFERSHSG